MKTIRKRTAFVIFLFAVASCVLLHLLQTNWTLRARLNLVLGGLVFCNLESPDQVNQPPVPAPPEFVSKLVYKGGIYKGYLNRYADFVSVEDSTPPGTIRGMNTVIILHYAKYACLLLSVALLGIFLWLRRSDSRASLH
jgi:hypothetical protein